MTVAPRVSVIVPVRDRRALLAELLDALDAQAPRGLRGARRRRRLDRRLRRAGGGGDRAGTAGARAARRRATAPSRPAIAGVEAAAGEILAFTDSDCRPDPGWLAAGVAALDAGADLVNGLTLPERVVGPLERSVWSGEEALYPTCNVLYRRGAFEAAGGFDTDAGRRWGFRFTRRARGLGFAEDTLLGWRVRRTGVAVHEPAALVVHHVFSADLREWVSRGVMLGSFPAIVRELPELRPTLLPRGVLFQQYARVPLYLAAGAGAARSATRRRPRSRSVWPVLKLGELRRARVTLAASVPALPALFVVDVVNAAALAAGSVRARTVVL